MNVSGNLKRAISMADLLGPEYMLKQMQERAAEAARHPQELP